MNSNLKKITALVCMAAMLTTGNTGLSIAAPTPQVLTTAADFPTDLARLAIPETLGTIEEAFLTGGNRTVILIQDAHAVPEAQNNIRKLITYFQKEYGAGAVALEGAAGPLDPYLLQKFPDQALLKKTMRAYHERAELSGTSAAALFDTGSSGYYGIEDWPLYEEGIALYQKAAKKEVSLLTQMKADRAAIQQQKEKVYSSELLAYDKLLDQYQAKSENLAETLKAADRILRAPQGSALEALIHQINAMDTVEEKLQQEMRQALQVFRENMTIIHKTMPASFNSAIQAFETGEMSAPAFALILKQAAREEKVRVSFQPELTRQVKMQNKLRQMKGTKLYDDLQTYFQKVKESLLTTLEQKKIDGASRRIDLMEKLARLELTREEWEEIKKSQVTRHKAQVESAKQGEGKRGKGKEKSEENLTGGNHLAAQASLDANKSPALSPLFREAVAFYENAEKREGAFLSKLNELLNKPQQSLVSYLPLAARRSSDLPAETGSTVIFVAGGFHSHGLARRFREENIRYLLITPKIKELPEKSSYREQMMGDVSWKKYFRVKNGRVNLRDAFLRAVRDNLLAVAAGLKPAATSNGERPQGAADHAFYSRLTTHDSRLIKLWRDDIIRGLADENRLQDAGSYTRFLDEVVASKGLSRLTVGALQAGGHTPLLDRLTSFIDGLKHLDNTKQLSEKNVFNLLKANTHVLAHQALSQHDVGPVGANTAQVPAIGGAFAKVSVPENFVRNLSKPSFKRSRQKVPGTVESLKVRSEVRSAEEDPYADYRFSEPKNFDLVSFVVSRKQVGQYIPQLPLAFRAFQNQGVKVRAFGGAIRALAFASRFDFPLPISELDFSVPFEISMGDQFERYEAALKEYETLLTAERQRVRYELDPYIWHPTDEKSFSVILEGDLEWSISKFWLEHDDARNEYVLWGDKNSFEDLRDKKLRLAGTKDFGSAERVVRQLKLARQLIRFGFTVEPESLKRIEAEIQKDIYVNGPHQQIRQEAKALIEEIRNAEVVQHPEMDQVKAESLLTQNITRRRNLISWAFAATPEKHLDRLKHILSQHLVIKRSFFAEAPFAHEDEGERFIVLTHQTQPWALKAPKIGAVQGDMEQDIRMAELAGSGLFAPFFTMSATEAESLKPLLQADPAIDPQRFWVAQKAAYSLYVIVGELQAAWQGTEDDQVKKEIEVSLQLIFLEWKRLVYRSWALGFVMNDYSIENAGLLHDGQILFTGESFDEHWNRFYIGAASSAELVNNANRQWLRTMFGSEEFVKQIYGTGLKADDFDLLWPVHADIPEEEKPSAYEKRAPIFSSAAEKQAFIDQFQSDVGVQIKRSEVRQSAGKFMDHSEGAVEQSLSDEEALQAVEGWKKYVRLDKVPDSPLITKAPIHFFVTDRADVSWQNQVTGDDGLYAKVLPPLKLKDGRYVVPIVGDFYETTDISQQISNAELSEKIAAISKPLEDVVAFQSRLAEGVALGKQSYGYPGEHEHQRYVINIKSVAAGLKTLEPFFETTGGVSHKTISVLTLRSLLWILHEKNDPLFSQFLKDYSLSFDELIQLPDDALEWLVPARIFLRGDDLRWADYWAENQYRPEVQDVGRQRLIQREKNILYKKWSLLNEGNVLKNDDWHYNKLETIPDKPFTEEALSDFEMYVSLGNYLDIRFDEKPLKTLRGAEVQGVVKKFTDDEIQQRFGLKRILDQNGHAVSMDAYTLKDVVGRLAFLPGNGGFVEAVSASGSRRTIDQPADFITSLIEGAELRFVHGRLDLKALGTIKPKIYRLKVGQEEPSYSRDQRRFLKNTGNRLSLGALPHQTLGSLQKLLGPQFEPQVQLYLEEAGKQTKIDFSEFMLKPGIVINSEYQPGFPSPSGTEAHQFSEEGLRAGPKLESLGGENANHTVARVPLGSQPSNELPLFGSIRFTPEDDAHGLRLAEALHEFKLDPERSVLGRWKSDGHLEERLLKTFQHMGANQFALLAAGKLWIILGSQLLHNQSPAKVTPLDETYKFFIYNTDLGSGRPADLGDYLSLKNSLQDQDVYESIAIIAAMTNQLILDFEQAGVLEQNTEVRRRLLQAWTAGFTAQRASVDTLPAEVMTLKSMGYEAYPEAVPTMYHEGRPWHYPPVKKYRRVHASPSADFEAWVKALNQSAEPVLEAWQIVTTGTGGGQDYTEQKRFDPFEVEAGRAVVSNYASYQMRTILAQRPQGYPQYIFDHRQTKIPEAKKTTPQPPLLSLLTQLRAAVKDRQSFKDSLEDLRAAEPSALTAADRVFLDYLTAVQDGLQQGAEFITDHGQTLGLDAAFFKLDTLRKEALEGRSEVRSTASSQSPFEFKQNTPKIHVFDQVAGIALEVSQKAFDADGKSRIYFDRIRNQLFLDGQPIDWNLLRNDKFFKQTVAQLVAQYQTTHPDRDILAVLPNGNLGFNAGYAGIAKGQFYHYRADAENNKSYDMLVTRKDGTLAVMTLKMKNAAGEVGIFDADDRDVSKEIDFAVAGQRLVKDGKNNLEEAALQTDDLRHLFRLPIFDAGYRDGADFTQFHLGVSDMFGELYRDSEKISQAIRGEAITLTTAPLNSFAIDASQSDAVFKRWGYANVTDQKTAGALLPGEYLIDEAAHAMTIKLLPGIHPHTFIGLTADGKILTGGVTGRTHFEGASLAGLIDELIRAGAKDVFLWANGKDTAVNYPDQEALSADNVRQEFLEVLLVTVPKQRSEVRAERVPSTAGTGSVFSAVLQLARDAGQVLGDSAKWAIRGPRTVDGLLAIVERFIERHGTLTAWTAVENLIDGNEGNQNRSEVRSISKRLRALSQKVFADWFGEASLYWTLNQRVRFAPLTLQQQLGTWKRLNRLKLEIRKAYPEHPLDYGFSKLYEQADTLETFQDYLAATEELWNIQHASPRLMLWEGLHKFRALEILTTDWTRDAPDEATALPVFGEGAIKDKGEAIAYAYKLRLSTMVLAFGQLNEALERVEQGGDMAWRTHYFKPSDFHVYSARMEQLHQEGEWAPPDHEEATYEDSLVSGRWEAFLRWAFILQKKVQKSNQVGFGVNVTPSGVVLLDELSDSENGDDNLFETEPYGSRSEVRTNDKDAQLSGWIEKMATERSVADVMRQFQTTISGLSQSQADALMKEIVAVNSLERTPKVLVRLAKRWDAETVQRELSRLAQGDTNFKWERLELKDFLRKELEMRSLSDKDFDRVLEFLQVLFKINDALEIKDEWRRMWVGLAASGLFSLTIFLLKEAAQEVVVRGGVAAVDKVQERMAEREVQRRAAMKQKAQAEADLLQKLLSKEKEVRRRALQDATRAAPDVQVMLFSQLSALFVEETPEKQTLIKEVYQQGLIDTADLTLPSQKLRGAMMVSLSMNPHPAWVPLIEKGLRSSYHMEVEQKRPQNDLEKAVRTRGVYALQRTGTQEALNVLQDMLEPVGWPDIDTVDGERRGTAKSITWHIREAIRKFQKIDERLVPAAKRSEVRVPVISSFFDAVKQGTRRGTYWAYWHSILFFIFLAGFSGHAGVDTMNGLIFMTTFSVIGGLTSGAAAGAAFMGRSAVRSFTEFDRALSEGKPLPPFVERVWDRTAGGFWVGFVSGLWLWMGVGAWNLWDPKILAGATRLEYVGATLPVAAALAVLGAAAGVIYGAAEHGVKAALDQNKNKRRSEVPLAPSEAGTSQVSSKPTRSETRRVSQAEIRLSGTRQPARAEMRTHALSELDLAPQYRQILEGFRQANISEAVIDRMEARIIEILAHQPPFVLRQGKPLLNLFRIFDPALDGRVTEFVSKTGAVYALLSEAFSKKGKGFYDHDNLTALYFASQIAAQTTQSGEPRYDLLSIGHKIKSEEAGGAVPDAMLYDRELGIYLIAEFRAGYGTLSKLLRQKNRQTLNYLRLLLNVDLEAPVGSEETILPQHVVGKNPAGFMWAVDQSVAKGEGWSVESEARNRLQGLIDEARKELERDHVPVRNDFSPDDLRIEFLDQRTLYRDDGTPPEVPNALALNPEDWAKVSQVLDSLSDTQGFSGFFGIMNTDLYGLAKKLNWQRADGSELSLEEIYYRYFALGATLEERLEKISKLTATARSEVPLDRRPETPQDEPGTVRSEVRSQAREQAINAYWQDLAEKLVTVFFQNNDFSIQRLGRYLLEQPADGAGDLFRDRGVNMNVNDARGRGGQKRQEITVAGQYDSLLFGGSLHERAVLSGFIRENDFVSQFLEELLGVAGDIFIQQKFHEQSLMAKGDEFTFLELLGREMEDGPDVLRPQLWKIIVGAYLLGGYVRFEQLKDLPRHNAGARNTGLSVTNFRRDTDQVPNVFHELELSTGDRLVQDRVFKVGGEKGASLQRWRVGRRLDGGQASLDAKRSEVRTSKNVKSKALTPMHRLQKSWTALDKAREKNKRLAFENALKKTEKVVRNEMPLIPSDSGTSQVSSNPTRSEMRSAESPVAGILREQIRENGGRITFRDFMETSLYHPQYGYYTSGKVSLGGNEGEHDFSTFVEKSPDAFAEGLLNHMGGMWQRLGEPEHLQIVEMGAGQGVLAAHVLKRVKMILTLTAAAEKSGIPKNPETQKLRRFMQALDYVIVEISPALKERQEKEIASVLYQPVILTNQVSDSQVRVRWAPFAAHQMTGDAVTGPENPLAVSMPRIFISNELPDAFPVHRVRMRGGPTGVSELQEAFVQTDADGHFIETWHTLEALNALRIETAIRGMGKEVEKRLRAGGEVAVNLQALEWQTQMAQLLNRSDEDRGYILTLDYGFPGKKYIPDNKISIHSYGVGIPFVFWRFKIRHPAVLKKIRLVQNWIEDAINRFPLRIRRWLHQHNPTNLFERDDTYLYERPGQVDITADVDFDMLADFGERLGLSAELIVSQRHFFELGHLFPAQVDALTRDGFFAMVQSKGVDGSAAADASVDLSIPTRSERPLGGSPETSVNSAELRSEMRSNTPGALQYSLEPVDQDAAFLHWLQKTPENALDWQLFDQIVSGDDAVLAQLMSQYPEKIYVNEIIWKENKRTLDPNDGRTVYLKLEHPFGDMNTLRIKSVRPQQQAGTPEVLGYGYKGRGFVPIEVSVAGPGKLLFKKQDKSYKPFGGALLKHALLEHRNLVRLHQSEMVSNVDKPLMAGRYSGIQFEGQPLGFVVIGMQGADQRFAVDLKQEREVYDGELEVLERLEASLVDYQKHQQLPVDGPSLLYSVGAILRKYHDAGFYHKYPHFGNFGVKPTADLQHLQPADMMIRDLGSTTLREELMGASENERTELAATYRWLDVVKVIRYLRQSDGLVEHYNEFLKEFMRGYFGDEQSQVVFPLVSHFLFHDEIDHYFDEGQYALPSEPERVFSFDFQPFFKNYKNLYEILIKLEQAVPRSKMPLGGSPETSVNSAELRSEMRIASVAAYAESAVEGMVKALLTADDELVLREKIESTFDGFLRTPENPQTFDPKALVDGLEDLLSKPYFMAEFMTDSRVADLLSGLVFLAADRSILTLNRAVTAHVLAKSLHVLDQMASRSLGAVKPAATVKLAIQELRVQVGLDVTVPGAVKAVGGLIAGVGVGFFLDPFARLWMTHYQTSMFGTGIPSLIFLGGIMGAVLTAIHTMENAQPGQVEMDRLRARWGQPSAPLETIITHLIHQSAAIRSEVRTNVPEDEEFDGATTQEFVLLPIEFEQQFKSKSVNGLIYSADFILEERQRAVERPTIAFDLADTLAHVSKEPEKFFNLRPGIESLLKDLKEAGVRLVLWTSDGGGSARLFFENHPALLELFDLVITADNYLVKSDTDFVAQMRTAYLTVGAAVDPVQRYMKNYLIGRAYNIPKDIALLGYRGLVDDRESWIQAIPDSPFYESSGRPQGIHVDSYHSSSRSETEEADYVAGWKNEILSITRAEVRSIRALTGVSVGLSLNLQHRQSLPSQTVPLGVAHHDAAEPSVARRIHDSLSISQSAQFYSKLIAERLVDGQGEWAPLPDDFEKDLTRAVQRGESGTLGLTPQRLLTDKLKAKAVTSLDFVMAPLAEGEISRAVLLEIERTLKNDGRLVLYEALSRTDPRRGVTDAKGNFLLEEHVIALLGKNGFVQVEPLEGDLSKLPVPAAIFVRQGSLPAERSEIRTERLNVESQALTPETQGFVLPAAETKIVNATWTREQVSSAFSAFVPLEKITNGSILPIAFDDPEGKDGKPYLDYGLTEAQMGSEWFQNLNALSGDAFWQSVVAQSFAQGALPTSWNDAPLIPSILDPLILKLPGDMQGRNSVLYYSRMLNEDGAAFPILIKTAVAGVISEQALVNEALVDFLFQRLGLSTILGVVNLKDEQTGLIKKGIVYKIIPAIEQENNYTLLPRQILLVAFDWMPEMLKTRLGAAFYDLGNSVTNLEGPATLERAIADFNRIYESRRATVDALSEERQVPKLSGDADTSESVRSEMRTSEERPSAQQRRELPLIDSVEAARSLLRNTPIRPIQESLQPLDGAFYRGVNGEEILENVISTQTVPPDRAGDGADWSDIWPAIRKSMALHDEPFDFGIVFEISGETAEKYDRKVVTWDWARSLDVVPVEGLSRVWLITAENRASAAQMQKTTKVAEIRLPGMPARSEVRQKSADGMDLMPPLQSGERGTGRFVDFPLDQQIPMEGGRLTYAMDLAIGADLDGLNDTAVETKNTRREIFSQIENTLLTSPNDESRYEAFVTLINISAARRALPDWEFDERRTELLRHALFDPYWKIRRFVGVYIGPGSVAKLDLNLFLTWLKQADQYRAPGGDGQHDPRMPGVSYSPLQQREFGKDAILWALSSHMHFEPWWTEFTPIFSQELEKERRILKESRSVSESELPIASALRGALQRVVAAAIENDPDISTEDLLKHRYKGGFKGEIVARLLPFKQDSKDPLTTLVYAPILGRSELRFQPIDPTTRKEAVIAAKGFVGVLNANGARHLGGGQVSPDAKRSEVRAIENVKNEALTPDQRTELWPASYHPELQSGEALAKLASEKYAEALREQNEAAVLWAGDMAMQALGRMIEEQNLKGLDTIREPLEKFSARAADQTGAVQKLVEGSFAESQKAAPDFEALLSLWREFILLHERTEISIRIIRHEGGAYDFNSNFQNAGLRIARLGNDEISDAWDGFIKPSNEIQQSVQDRIAQRKTQQGEVYPKTAPILSFTEAAVWRQLLLDLKDFHTRDAYKAWVDENKDKLGNYWYFAAYSVPMFLELIEASAMRSETALMDVLWSAMSGAAGDVLRVRAPYVNSELPFEEKTALREAYFGSLREQGVEFDVQISPEAKVYVEPLLFSQALRTLMKNSLQVASERLADENEERKLNPVLAEQAPLSRKDRPVKFRIHYDGSTLDVIELVDNAGGIAEKDSEFLEETYSGSGRQKLMILNNSRRKNDTGFGLAFVWHVIHMHGGVFALENTQVDDPSGQKKGLRVTIRLPKKESEPSGEGQDSSKARSEVRTQNRIQRSAAEALADRTALGVQAKEAAWGLASALETGDVTRSEVRKAIQVTVQIGAAPVVERLEQLRAKLASNKKPLVSNGQVLNSEKLQSLIELFSGKLKAKFSSADTSDRGYDVTYVLPEDPSRMADFARVLSHFGQVGRILVHAPDGAKLPENIRQVFTDLGLNLTMIKDLQRAPIYLGEQTLSGLVAGEGRVEGQPSDAFVPVIESGMDSEADPLIRELVLTLQTAVALLVAEKGRAGMQPEEIRAEALALLKDYELMPGFESRVIQLKGNTLIISATVIRDFAVEWAARQQVQVAA